MSTAADYDRGWVLTRSLAFIFLRVTHVLINLLVYSVAAHTGLAMMWAIDHCSNRVRPPAPIDPATDLRAFYLVSP